MKIRSFFRRCALLTALLLAAPTFNLSRAVAAVGTTAGVTFYSDKVAGDEPRVETISDEQLLALFKGVRSGCWGAPGGQRLVIFNAPTPNTK